MANINVTNLDNMVRGYVISQLSQKFPGVDLTEHSSFDDLFIKPMVTLLTPVFRQMNALEMRTNLENAPFLSEEDLDRVLEGNYLMERKLGAKGTTELLLTFLDVTYGDYIQIPPNHVFQTQDGKRFQTTRMYTFTFDELAQYYNGDSLAYEVPVFVESTGVGTQYNVPANTIIESPVLFHTGLVSVTNPAPVRDATDKESNFDYAQRGRNFYISRHLGTKPGYEAFIFENFEEVNDVYVVGYTDEFMERDKIMIHDPDTGLNHERHIGGMTDIYIAGSLYVEEQETIALTTNYMPLSIPYAQVVSESVTAFNLTEPEKTPVILSKLDVDDDMVVVLSNAADESFNPAQLSDIMIIYQYVDLDVSEDPIERTDTFTVGKKTTSLSTPLSRVESLSFAETGEMVPDYDMHYNLVRSGQEGTTKETVEIELVGFDTQKNGTAVTVSYMINSTLKSLGLVFEQNDQRIITADVMCLETGIVDVNVAFKVKMKPGHFLDDVTEARIRAATAGYFGQIKLRSPVHESDLVAHLYADENVVSAVEYVHLPFDSFYLPDDREAELTETRTGTTIPINEIAKPRLNKFGVVALND